MLADAARARTQALRLDDITPEGSGPEARESHLLAMVEGALSGLVLLGETLTILAVNGTAAEILGAERAALVGRSAGETGRAAGFDWSVAGEVVSKRTAVTTVQTLKGGRKVLASGTPVLSAEDRLVYVVLTLEDVTAMGRLVTRLREVTESRAAGGPGGLEGEAFELVAASAAVRTVRDKAVQYAKVDSPVLLLGETGTGKGVFARLIHQTSPRAGGPFLEVNCGAIPEGLIEAELFGYARGAFTGADSRGKIGLVELAHQGTLLLNEIGDLPLPLQVKLLRFLEDGEVWPVGAVRGRRPDVRIIAATNRDLVEMISHRGFRKDLYYRLNVLSIAIPPLREHPEDIPKLMDMMLAQLGVRLGKRPQVAPEALDMILRYAFPGNVRELWNLMERLVVTTNSESVGPEHMPVEVAESVGAAAGPLAAPGQPLRRAVERLEAHLIKEALVRYGTQVGAAKHLGVAQSTVARKAKQYSLGNSLPG